MPPEKMKTEAEIEEEMFNAACNLLVRRQIENRFYERQLAKKLISMGQFAQFQTQFKEQKEWVNFLIEVRNDRLDKEAKKKKE